MIPEAMSEETQESLDAATLAELLRVRETIKGFRQKEVH